jgi:phage terminase small subunit
MNSKRRKQMNENKEKALDLLQEAIEILRKEYEEEFEKSVKELKERVAIRVALNKTIEQFRKARKDALELLSIEVER